jgi:hypothetical protein
MPYYEDASGGWRPIPGCKCGQCPPARPTDAVIPSIELERLRRIEAAARTFVTTYDEPYQPGDDSWQPVPRAIAALRAALSGGDQG